MYAPLEHKNMWTFKCRRILARQCLEPRFTRRSKSQKAAATSETGLDLLKEQFRGWGSGTVHFKKDGSIGTITLDYPERLNAMSGKMMAEFHDAVLGVEAGLDSLKAVILTSKGDYFCAGGDLSTVAQHLNQSQRGLDMSRLMHSTIEKLGDLPVVSLAVIRGRALGGGAELALATDLRSFSPSGKLSFVQARMGISPGWAGGHRLVRCVGQSRALNLMLSCRTLHAKEAADIGLCDLILKSDEEEEAMREAVDWLSMLTRHDASVISGIKAICNCDLPETEALELEQGTFASLWAGPANLKALESKLKH